MGAEIKRAWFDTDYPGESSSSTDWQHGWTAGAGIEHMFTSHATIRLEYRYSDYGKETIDTSALFDLGLGSSYKEKQNFDEHSIRIGVGYKF